jgi:hypothetical protein
MQVLTKRASEEVLIGQVARVVVLETAAEEVKLAVLDAGHGFTARGGAAVADAERHAGRRVRVIAPYGETIEIDA